MDADFIIRLIAAISIFLAVVTIATGIFFYMFKKFMGDFWRMK